MAVFTKKRSIQNLRDDAEYGRLEQRMLGLLDDERLAERTARTVNTTDARMSLAKTREALKAAQAAVRERRREVAREIARSMLPEFLRLVGEMKEYLIDAHDRAILIRDMQLAWSSDDVLILSEPDGQRIADALDEIIAECTAPISVFKGFK